MEAPRGSAAPGQSRCASSPAERDIIAECTSRATLVRLAREPEWVERQGRVLGLSAEGLSQRAIATELGLAKETVARVLRRAG